MKLSHYRIRLGSDRSRERRQPVVRLPIVPRLGGSAREQPEPNALVIHAEQVGEATDRTRRVGAHPRNTVEEMLGSVIGGVPDEGFRIDHQPWLSLRPKDVPCVQVGGRALPSRARCTAAL